MAKSLQEMIQEARQQVQEINIAQVASLAKGGKVAIIDVREPAEFEAGALPNAINIPRGVLEFRVTASCGPADSIILYCQGGSRSILAARTLNQMGYQDVRSMAGGYDAWLAAGQSTPTVRHRE